MKTQTMPIPAKSELVPAKLYVRTKTVKSEPVNLNDVDVMTKQLGDYEAPERLYLAAALFVASFVLCGAVLAWMDQIKAVASWIIG